MLVEIFMFNVSSCHKAKKGEISKTFATKFCKKTGYFHPLLETIFGINVVNNEDFNKRLECATPKCWYKYTIITLTEAR